MVAVLGEDEPSPLRIIRNGIVSTWVERMAAQNACERKPATLDESKMRDRFQPVLRTGGDEATTGRQERREQSLIQSNQTEREIFHKTNCEHLHLRAVQVSGIAQQISAAQNDCDGGIHLLELTARRAAARDQDQIPTGHDHRQTRADTLTHPAFRAIARHRLADLFARHKPEPTRCHSVCARTQNHERMRKRFAVIPDALKIRAASQTE